MVLSACGSLPPSASKSANGAPPSVLGGDDSDGAPLDPIDVSAIPEPIPRIEPRARYGNPAYYEVFGKGYRTLTSSAGYVERGIASWYGTKFHKRRTSSGEPYDLYGITAAHKTLPLPTYVQVTNLDNGRKLIVRVNDRGPFHEGRIIDLSYAAAGKLGILPTGTGRVEVRAIDPRRYRPEPLLAQNSPAPSTQMPSAAPRAEAVAAPITDTATSVQKDEMIPAPLTIASAQTITRPVSIATAETPAPRLYLQVGAFFSRVNAERLCARLAAASAAGVEIIETSIQQNTIYRVRLGPLKDTAEADRISQTVAALGVTRARRVMD